MKFVALALALLLAVGSQAASLQADAPSALEHARAALDLYLTHLKEGAKRVVDQLDNTEYSYLKEPLNQRLEDMHTNFKTAQGVVGPMTDTVVSTLSDTTADMRTVVMADVEDLKSSLAAEQEKLREVVERHIEDYRSTLEPVIASIYEKHAAAMEELKSQVMPAVAEMREKMRTNVEETKVKLQPIVDAVREKITAHGLTVKEQITPYITEYKDQLKAAYAQAQKVNTEELAGLREKIAPMTEDIKAKMQDIMSTIAAYVQKN